MRTAIETVSQSITLQSGEGATYASPVYKLVAWSGERWRIVRVAQNLDAFEPGGLGEVVAGIFEVLPDGSLRPDDGEMSAAAGALAAASSGASPFTGLPRSTPVAVARDGTVAVVRSHGPPVFAPVGPESLEFVVPGGDSSILNCAGRISVAPVERGDDWFVLCADPAQVTLGRYDPRRDDWSVPARPLAIDMNDQKGLGIGVHAGSAIVLLEDLTDEGGSTGLSAIAVLPDAAEPEPRALPAELGWRPLDATFLNPERKLGYFSTESTADWLLPTWFEEMSVSTPTSFMGAWIEPLALRQVRTGLRLGQDGRVGSPVRFVLSSVDEIDGVAFAGIAETGALAFCFVESRTLDSDAGAVTRNELLFSLFDAQGARTAGPLLLAESTGPLTDCELTWSGTAFLATWFDAPSFNAPDNLRARIVRLH